MKNHFIYNDSGKEKTFDTAIMNELCISKTPPDGNAPLQYQNAYVSVLLDNERHPSIRHL